MYRIVVLSLILTNFQVRSEEECPYKQCLTRKITCEKAYHLPTIDGTCNNLDNPHWGAGNTVMPRFLAPDYGDGKGSLRLASGGGYLPSPREVSNALKDGTTRYSTGVSHMHVLWGQFIAHDIVHTPIIKKPDNTKLDCNCENPDEGCINIKIPENDAQRINTGKKCFGLARSKPAVGADGCEFHTREQITTMSSVFDGTMLYGKSDQEAKELRDLSSNAGELRTGKQLSKNPHKLLPSQDEMKDTKISKTMDCPMKVHKPVKVGCFVTGDVRNNENTGLTSIHTLWMRYHNKVAREMKTVNPSWNSDKIFHTVRRIMAALIQIITYREYLPYLLGPDHMKRYDLELNDYGYWNGYDPKCNPAIMNEFTTTAFRYGHSQVASKLSRPSPYYTGGFAPDVDSKDSFFNSKPLLNKTGGGVGSLMRGFMIDSAEMADTNFVDDLRNQLFTEFGKKYGGDLFSINIQRGRDHGLRNYNDYRELCGLTRAKTFNDLSYEISYEKIEKLKSVYRSVDDIDLYVGGLNENTVDGGEVGPTFACIMAHQFRALRKGDRYWHEHEFSPSGFTPDQLEALRRIKFSRIICDSADDMQFVFKDPMVASRSGRTNIVYCGRSLPELDLTAWKSTSYKSDSIPDSTWTVWFPTKEDRISDFNIPFFARQLRGQRKHEMCVNYENHQIRFTNSKIQIRFSCPKGSIRATDFPHQVSQKTYWTHWMNARPIQGDYDSGVQIGIHEFGCEKVLGIQAKSLDSKKYARETGNVFEAYSKDFGFICLDAHQSSGACERYQVRALCMGRRSHKKHPYNTHEYGSKSKGPDKHETMENGRKQYISQPTIPSYSSPKPTFSYYSSKKDLTFVTNGYCSKYGLCCTGKRKRRRRMAPKHIPEAIQRSIRRLCQKFQTCCYHRSLK